MSEIRRFIKLVLFVTLLTMYCLAGPQGSPAKRDKRKFASVTGISLFFITTVQIILLSTFAVTQNVF